MATNCTTLRRPKMRRIKEIKKLYATEATVYCSCRAATSLARRVPVGATPVAAAPQSGITPNGYSDKAGDCQ